MRHIAILLTWVALAAPGSALAQGADASANPGLVAPKADFAAPAELDAFAPTGETPALGEVLAPPAAGHELALDARLTADGPTLADGLIWRVFADETDAAGELQLVDMTKGGSARVTLEAGRYIVHVAFGRAAETRTVTIGDRDAQLDVVLDAGGLRLGATAGDAGTINSDHLTFEVMEDGDDQSPAAAPAAALIPDARPGEILRLPAGTYHVVSRYGDVNSIVRADIKVTAGKLTEAVMRHNAAEVTLKLVSSEGGEALANTGWTVLTAGGDTVHESVGAFPSLVLAEGTYTVIASHQDDIYSRDFTVEAGVDRDVEVRLSEDLVRPEPVDNRGPKL